MTIDLALELGHGIIRTSQHRRLRNQLSAAVTKRRLTRLYPGVLVSTELAGDPTIRCRAALVWRPDLVLTGAAAVRVGFWPTFPVDVIEAAGPHIRTRPSGIVLSQRSIPAELRCYWEPGQVATATHAILDRAASGDWAPLCEGLRTRAVTPTDIARAAELLSGRPGVEARDECVARSKGEPWSVPELQLQQLYLAAGLTDWVGNSPLILDGRRVIPDIAFHELRVAVEVDGRAHHAQAESFQADRQRHNLFTAHGWRVLHFTPQQIRDQPEVVLAQTLATLAAAAHDRSPWR